ncbi:alpha/beta fold hydrolase [Mucilaginibacter psychrotolerans]|uniref:Alpha/beta hydrolase n=1 Tax=Mucilaginibacter psychrotolerans TaxID=1524096 RepID=A0A4Y8S4T6_9SPHI|nr:alpha/beta hydrolase [Mucilaginibacter psychrotolerans]TFF33746.1 alpha/beta hydrolase [Mucilaginibacter psychrotolerans]
MKFLKRTITFLLVLIIFGAAAVAILYFTKNKETKEITYNLRKNTNGSYLELSGGITHYELDGPDSGKVVVMIHGFSVPYYIWNGTYEYLTEHGFRVLRYDEFGRGYSDRPDTVYNKQLYMDQLKDLLTKLEVKMPVSLVGVSFGGAVATDFACAYPDWVNKVVLVDPVYNFGHPDFSPYITTVKELFGADKRALGQMEDFKYPDKHPTWVDQYVPQMEYRGFRHALISTQYNYDFNPQESYAALNSKNKPVMLIWGKDDKTVPFTFADSVNKLVKTEFLPVDDAGHLPFLEQPEIVNPTLVTFLKK